MRDFEISKYESSILAKVLRLVYAECVCSNQENSNEYFGIFTIKFRSLKRYEKFAEKFLNICFQVNVVKVDKFN